MSDLISTNSSTGWRPGDDVDSQLMTVWHRKLGGKALTLVLRGSGLGIMERP